MSYLDFDYLIVSNRYLDLQSLKNTFSFFTSLGIRKFIIPLGFDRNIHTVPWMIRNIKNFKEYIRPIRPHGISVFICADIYMSDDIFYDKAMHRLTLGDSDMIFLKMPIFSPTDWINSELNYCLYKAKFNPIFTTFESNIRTAPYEFTDQLFTTHAFKYCLDLDYITSLESTPRISQAISNGISIFPCISRDVCHYQDIIRGFSDFRNRIGDKAYFSFCDNLRLSKQTLFSAIK